MSAPAPSPTSGAFSRRSCNRSSNESERIDELIESAREGGRVLRGEAKASREFVFTLEDVQAIRKKLKKSQDEFALMIGVSVATR
jgi:DNA-binding transcriptional regulator YiaG